MDEHFAPFYRACIQTDPMDQNASNHFGSIRKHKINDCLTPRLIDGLSAGLTETSLIN